MVDTEISQQMINSGARLVQQLDAIDLAPDAAFWMYFPDTKTWKLAIFDQRVEKIGPKEIYSKIKSVLDKYSKEIQLSLDNVALMKTNAPLLALLRTAVRTGPGIAGIRFKRNVVNGTLIEDAYIYRLK
jgi:hypothetical protein